MKNKVIEILESSQRINAEINRIVNRHRVYGEDEKANKMREELRVLAQMVRDEMIEIHNLNKK